MGSAQVVLWTEGETGPRFPLDTASIAEAGGVLRLVACRDTREGIEAARDARVLVVSHAAVPEELFRRAPRLVGVVRTGIGLDTVDVASATRYGVCVAHVPDFCHDEVADTTWALLLAVARKVLVADRAVRQGRWAPNALLPMYRLRGRTLGSWGSATSPARSPGGRHQGHARGAAPPVGHRLAAHPPHGGDPGPHRGGRLPADAAGGDPHQHLPRGRGGRAGPHRRPPERAPRGGGARRPRRGASLPGEPPPPDGHRGPHSPLRLHHGGSPGGLGP